MMRQSIVYRLTAGGWAVDPRLADMATAGIGALESLAAGDPAAILDGNATKLLGADDDGAGGVTQMMHRGPAAETRRGPAEL